MTAGELATISSKVPSKMAWAKFREEEVRVAVEAEI